jgi:hypothetical protein
MRETDVPSKFVANAAEKTGVSLETAEHRWAEAKKAIKKGKRRGSWYWGKVMNTFKRMMGLSEAVTLKEWLLLEDDLNEEVISLPQATKDWPEEAVLSPTGYTLSKFPFKGRKMMYGVGDLMDEQKDKVGYVTISKRGGNFLWQLHLNGVTSQPDWAKRTVIISPHPPGIESDFQQFKQFVLRALRDTAAIQEGAASALEP